jgi:putative acetyltransferase
MNQDLSIRPYAADDTKRLVDIWYDASLISHAFIGEATLAVQRKLIEEQYLPIAETWVAVAESEIVGFISLLDDFVGGLFVDPQWQGKGIGRRLISHAAQLRGPLSLNVYTANEQAMGFYQSMGFQEVSRRAVDDDGHPFENAQLMLTHAPAHL